MPVGFTNTVDGFLLQQVMYVHREEEIAGEANKHHTTLLV